MTHFHNFIYGASRTGKTTLAAQLAKAGLKTLAITMEPGVTKAAFTAEGAEATIHTPSSSEALFVFVDYPTEYIAKHGFEVPNLVLFDNLQGLQNLIIGRPAEAALEVEGIKIPFRGASGIIGKIPKSAKGDEANPEALSQAQYGVLGRYTRRFLNAVDSMPYSTLITTTEQYDFDEKAKKDAQGRTPQQAAGRPRTVKGWPATEGSMSKHMLPSCISGAVIHLTRADGPLYTLHTRTHTDDQGVEWFADPRGLSGVAARVDWTGKDMSAVFLDNGATPA